MCPELTPRARIPDTRIPQFMQPCIFEDSRKMRLIVSKEITRCLPQSRCCPPTSCQSAPSCRPPQERTAVRVLSGIKLIPHIKIQSLSAKIMSRLFRSTSLPIVTNWYLRENQRHPVPLSHMSNFAGSQFDHWVGAANSEVTAITIFVTTKILVLISLLGTYLSQIGNLFRGVQKSKKLKAKLHTKIEKKVKH